MNSVLPRLERLGLDAGTAPNLPLVTVTPGVTTSPLIRAGFSGRPSEPRLGPPRGTSENNTDSLAWIRRHNDAKDGA